MKHCEADCPYAGKEWPRNMPKPDCRIKAEMALATNPVTKWSMGEILLNREAEECQILCKDLFKKEKYV